MASWLSWLERRPVTAEVVGSSPIGVVIVNYFHIYGILAQLGEHLPYKQRVIGSSPIGPILYSKLKTLLNLWRIMPRFQSGFYLFIIIDTRRF